ncbi:MAG: TonB-dependent receptor [Pirellulales bacterium]|nr:TonB-dependent receptor [Pirellulales bacterium]
MRKVFSLIVRGGIVAVGCWLGMMPLFLGAQDLGPAPLPGGAANSGSSSSSNAGDTDLDKMLDMDLRSLGQVQAKTATMTDPIVEAVSKTPEKASEAAGIVDVITAKDIEEFGAKNLYEVLQWATSVYMTGSFLWRQNVAVIRGDLRKHEDNLVLVLINGRPFRDVTLGGVNVSIYTAFPIHTIERVEVIRGPGSVLYGTNAFTGVINVVTKNPKEPTLHASVLSGSYGWQSYSVAAGNGNDAKGFYGGATYINERGWPFTATLEDPPGPIPSETRTYDFGQNNIGVFTMYRNGGLTANLFVARATSDIVGSSVEWPPIKLDDPRVFLDVGYLIKLEEDRSLDLHFTYNFDEAQFPSVIVDPFIAPSHSFLLEGTYRRELWDGMNLMIGGTVDFHTGVAVMGPFEPIPQYNEIWYSAYMQFDYRVNEWLKLVGGMQGNMPGSIHSGIVPRAGIIVSHNENWTTKFLYGQAFRSPYQIERSINVPGVVVGNPNLVPELIQTFDVQLAYHTDDYRFAATYFHSDVYHLITRVGTLPETYVNLGSMSFQGIELENEWRVSDRLRWLGSVTYQNNVRDDEHNVTAAPIWMAKMGASYHNDRGLNVALMDVFYGACGVSDTAAHVNPEPDAYHLASLNMSLDLNRHYGWRMNREMRLQFLIQNLFNESINHVEFQRGLINTLPAGPGRTFYGGFTMAY